MDDSRAPAPSGQHRTDVFSQLPSLLMRALDTAEVGAAVDALVAGGWRPGQLRHRIGSAPSQGSLENDARAVLALLRSLLETVPPDVAHARAWAERQRERAERAEAPAAAPEVRDRYVAQIRAGLTGTPRTRRTPEPRARPACNLCEGDGVFFVSHEVHLCRRCVAVIATGEARLAAQGEPGTGWHRTG